MRVARRWDVVLPRIVDILLAFNYADRAARGDRGGDFVDPIQDRGVSAAESLRPSPFAVWVAEPAFDLGAGRVSDFAEADHTIAIAILVRRHDFPIGALGLLRSAPITVIAMPDDTPVGFDLHAEAFGLLVLLAAVRRALWACRVILAGPIGAQLNAMRMQDIFRLVHDAAPASITGSRRNQSSASSSRMMVCLPIFRPRSRPDLISS